MASGLKTLRDGIETLFNDKKALNQFVYNDFEVEGTFLPLESLQNYAEKGKVWIIGLDSDDGPNLSRSNLTTREVPLQIALQRQAKPNDKDLLDTMVELNEQLRSAIINYYNGDNTEFSWMRNVSMKDPTGTPYAYALLKDKGYFHAYFTSFFQYVLQPEE
jgi:hypothetical protein